MVTEHPSIIHIESTDTYTTTKTIVKRRWFKKKYVNVHTEERINYLICTLNGKFFMTSTNKREFPEGITSVWKEVSVEEIERISRSNVDRS